MRKPIKKRKPSPRKAPAKRARNAAPKRKAAPPKRKAAPKRRRNSSAEADAVHLTEEFHGRPVRRVKDYQLEEAYHDRLADLGKLLRLDVLMADGSPHRFTFKGGVRVMCSPNGRQIVFVGGNQDLGLETEGKDLVEVGWVVEIEYHTRKDFHNFEPVDYHHHFGEEGGELPLLLYDAMNKRMLLSGGSYRVERPGIID